MANIKWLHLSDIHINKRGVDNQLMREKLLEFLRENQFKCNYVFITGDLRYAPEGSFSKDTVNFLKEICSIVEIPVNNLYIVPGNHDIDRDNSKRERAVTQLLSGNYNSKDGIIPDELLDGLKSGRDEFLTLIRELYADDPERILYFTDKNMLHFCIETDDFNIIHLDSTVTYKSDQNRDFIIGTEQLMNALNKANPSKITIILTHYSFDFLTRNEQKMIIGLLKNYNVQLWLSGHEHDELLRKQRDYFYEFQCGDLINDGDDTKSCFAIGEYDTLENKGVIKLYCWDSPNGWAVSQFISNQKEKSQYRFELENNNSIIQEIISTVKSEEFKSNSDEKLLLDRYQLSPRKVKYLERMRYIKPNNISNDYEYEEEFYKFLDDVESYRNVETISDDKCEEEYECNIYFNNSFAPDLKAHVTHLYNESVNQFVVDDGVILFDFFVKNGKPIYASFLYDLSGITSAEDRLYYFKKIQNYVQSKRIFIKMCNHEEHNILFEDYMFDEKDEVFKSTQFWIEQMIKIINIESYFDIKFRLPRSATRDDYMTIEILNDSIEKKESYYLPVIPMEPIRLKKKIHLQQDVMLDSIDELPNLQLFGYKFKPISQYILAGDYRWDKKLKGWVAKRKKNNGVPIRVEFEVNFDDDKNIELLRKIPLSEFNEELREIRTIEGDDANFLLQFTQFIFDYHEIWKLFLSYISCVDNAYSKNEAYMDIYFCDNENNKCMDAITLNTLTNSMISAGKLIVERIDHLMKRLGFKNSLYVSNEWIKSNISYFWLVSMMKYSSYGHFPVSIGNEEPYFYYDISSIKYIIKNSDDKELLESIEFFENIIDDLGLDANKLDHYILIRNFMLEIAKKIDLYYNDIKDVLCRYIEKLSDLLHMYPDLMVHEGEFKNYVVYKLNGDDEPHAFRYDVDFMADYDKYSYEAKKYLNNCKKDLKGKF